MNISFSHNKIPVFVTILLLLAPVSRAAAVDFHVGIGFGPATIEENLGFDDGSLVLIDYDEDVLAATIYGEMKFNRFVRFEFGLLDNSFATMEAESFGGPFWFPGPVEVSYSIGGLKAGAVGTFPIVPGDKVKLLVKGGLIAWGAIVQLEDSWGTVDDNDAGIDPYFGIGAEFDLSRTMSLRLQHERFSVDADSDVFVGGYEYDYQNTTFGVLFRF